MPPSYDNHVSLLCMEDTSFFDDTDYGDSMDMVENLDQSQNYGDPNPNWLLPLQSYECLALMVEKECHHLPASDYVIKLKRGDLEFGARKEAIDWIEKVREHFGFGPLCAYLSINYLDRFLSAYEFPKQRAWTMPLLALACLSLAAKVDEPNVPLTLDLQVGVSKFVFESKTIQKMELMVLSTLKWRMQAITPFSFIDYFISKISHDETTIATSILLSTQLILNIARGIDFLEFRSSEIAAAVAISVVEETQTGHTEKAISVLIQHVDKERVLQCVKMIHELSSGSDSAKDASAASVFVPQSPLGVLGAECFSYKSDDTNAGSCANSSHNNSPDAKRRKLNMTC